MTLEGCRACDRPAVMWEGYSSGARMILHGYCREHTHPGAFSMTAGPWTVTVLLSWDEVEAWMTLNS